jgi:hypothetical protein
MYLVGPNKKAFKEIIVMLLYIFILKLTYILCSKDVGITTNKGIQSLEIFNNV